MKFSVVIPLYNKASCIFQTISSVLNQDYTDYEIIVVDDGSTDSSAEIVQSIASPKINLIQQENSGVSVARNKGIAESKGDYIAFLDADDLWRNDYLTQISKIIELYPACGFYVSSYCVHLPNARNSYPHRMSEETGVIDSYWKTYAISRYDFVWTSATVISKELLLKSEGFRIGEKLGQDLDAWVRVAKLNAKVAYNSNICVDYMRNAENNARTRIKIAWAGAFLNDLENELNSSNHTEEEYNSIQYKYNMKMTVYIFTDMLNGNKKHARLEIKRWKGFGIKRCILRCALLCASLLPCKLLKYIYGIRLRVY